MFIQINNKKIRKDRIESVEIVKSINDDYIPTIKTDNINITESGEKYVYNIHIIFFPKYVFEKYFSPVLSTY